jgi:YHYH protein
MCHDQSEHHHPHAPRRAEDEHPAGRRPSDVMNLFAQLGRTGLTMSRRSFLSCSAIGIGSLLLAACGAAQAPARSELLAPLANMPIPGFDAFKERLTIRMDETYIYIESDGLPAHLMMIGIRSWQQQAPLPQPYVGANAWRIPRHAEIAATPISAKHALYRGAIALAINGVPIFNALNNRGDDAYLAGELDRWGGHAGRADDYHYHIAPLHLQAIVGPAQPIAYALDGFAMYGLTEPDGAPVTGLDEFNGHFDAAGNYHYHATPTYPYINGGMRGVVRVRDDQVDPQPQAAPVRPPLQPLAGARITGFQSTGTNAYVLEYQIDQRTYQVKYRFTGNTYSFEFVDASGTRRTETYTRAE